MTNQRPQGVLVLAVLYVLVGVLSVFSGLLLLAVQADLSNYLAYLGIRASFVSGTVLGVATMLIGALYIAVGWGLWHFREWARIVALILSGLGLLGSLFLMAIALSAQSITLGVLELIPAGIDAAILWYLLQPNVAEAFAGQGTYAGEISAGESTVSLSPLPVTPGPELKPTKVAQPAPIIAWLVVHKGPQQGQFGLASGTSVLGRDRSKCDIAIEDDAVSREHAKIRFEGGRFWIYDLGSRNGTFVNSQRVQRQMLMDGDRIQVGDTVLVFKEVR